MIDELPQPPRPYADFEDDLLGRQYPALLERLGLEQLAESAP
jgi:hypothetical protein